MKKLYFIGFLFVTTTSFGQLSFGIRTGFNVSYLSSPDSEDKTGFAGGGYLNLGLNKRFSVQPEIIYSRQGASGEANLALGAYIPGTWNSRLSYLNIPVLLKYRVLGVIAFQTGPQLGILLNANQSDNYPGSTSREITKDLKPTDLGWVFGVGFELPAGFDVTARYTLGMTDLWNDSSHDYTYQGHGKNLVLQLTVGYKLFGKK